MTTPSPTIGAVERMRARAAKIGSAEFQDDVDAIEALITTLQSKLSLAEGALEEATDQLWHLAKDPKSNALVTSLRDTLVKMREGAEENGSAGVEASGSGSLPAPPEPPIHAGNLVGKPLPDHLKWPGPGPEPASWMVGGVKVYRSYSDYCDD